ncbi:unnamed protein product, partial [Trypanosoma congolense IL3000]
MRALLAGFVLGIGAHACVCGGHSYGSSIYVSPLPQNLNNSLVFVDIVRCRAGVLTAHRSAAGRVTIELFDDASPVSTTNFRELCRGRHGKSGTGHDLCYRGTRLFPDKHCITGGDVTFGLVPGGWSIYGKQYRETPRKNNAKGAGLLYAIGEHSHLGSEFVIGMEGFTPDREHVLLGQVLEGYGALQKVQQQCSRPCATHFISYHISDAGVLREAKTPNYRRGWRFLRF